MLVAAVGIMREINASYISDEALNESGRLGYEFYRQVWRCLRQVSYIHFAMRGCSASPATGDAGPD